LRAILDTGVKEITQEMKLAAAKSVSNMIGNDLISALALMPDPLDYDIFTNVAAAIAYVGCNRELVDMHLIGNLKSEVDFVKYFRSYTDGNDQMNHQMTCLNMKV